MKTRFNKDISKFLLMVFCLTSFLNFNIDLNSNFINIEIAKASADNYFTLHQIDGKLEVELIFYYKDANSYSIKRNEEVKAIIASTGSEIKWIDTDIVPGTEYRYEVIASKSRTVCENYCYRLDIGGHWCLLSGTQVEMQDGSQKNVEDIEVGEKVIGLNNEINEVLDLHRSQVGDYGIYLINNSLEITPNHPILVRNLDDQIVWKIAEKKFYEYGEMNDYDFSDYVFDSNPLTIGDKMLLKNSEVEISSIEKKEIDRMETVYNLTTTGNQTFLANDVIVKAWPNTDLNINLVEVTQMEPQKDFLEELVRMFIGLFQIPEAKAEDIIWGESAVDYLQNVFIVTGGYKLPDYGIYLTFAAYNKDLDNGLRLTVKLAANQVGVSYTNPKNYTKAEKDKFLKQYKNNTNEATIKNCKDWRLGDSCYPRLTCKDECHTVIDQISVGDSITITPYGPICGSASGEDKYYEKESEIPVNNLCVYKPTGVDSFTSAIDLKVGESLPWQWSCTVFPNNSAKKIKVDCGANFISRDGCGSANGETYCGKPPLTLLCPDGSSLSSEPSPLPGMWMWICEKDGVSATCASNDSCHTSDCGSSNGQTFNVKPTTNLCKDGSTPDVKDDTTNSNWYWDCGETRCTATPSTSAYQCGTYNGTNVGSTDLFVQFTNNVYKESFCLNSATNNKNSLTGAIGSRWDWKCNSFAGTLLDCNTTTGGGGNTCNCGTYNNTNVGSTDLTYQISEQDYKANFCGTSSTPQSDTLQKNANGTWSWWCMGTGGKTCSCITTTSGGGGGGGGGGGSRSATCGHPPTSIFYYVDKSIEMNKSLVDAYCEATSETEEELTNCKLSFNDKLCGANSVPSQVVGNNPWTWQCSLGTSVVSCSTDSTDEGGDGDCGDECNCCGNKVSASICGTAHGKKIIAKPFLGNDLCRYGYATYVLGDGPWTWGCRIGKVMSCCSASRDFDDIEIIGQARSSSGARLITENMQREYGAIQVNEFSQAINRNIDNMVQSIQSELASINSKLNSPGNEPIVIPAGDFSNISTLKKNVWKLKDGQVYYIKNRNLVLGDSIETSGRRNFVNFDSNKAKMPLTFIVDGGDVIIKNNLKYGDSKSSIGVFVLQNSRCELGQCEQYNPAIDSNNLAPTERGGNIYIDPAVTDIVGAYYAEGSVMSLISDSNNLITEDEIYDNFSLAESTKLNNQLYIQGLLISRNTMYGSLGNRDGNNTGFVLPFSTSELTSLGNRYLNMPEGLNDVKNFKSCANNSCNNANTDIMSKVASRFDLNELRQFQVDDQGNPIWNGLRSINVIEMLANGNLDAVRAAKRLILRYDNLVQLLPPPGFENTVKITTN